MTQLELSSDDARDTGGELFDGRSWDRGWRRKGQSRCGRVTRITGWKGGRHGRKVRTSSNKGRQEQASEETLSRVHGLHFMDNRPGVQRPHVKVKQE